MTLTLLSSGPDFALLTDGWRIRKGDVQPLTEAAGLLAAAGERARTAGALADAARDHARREGFAAGLREGRAAGAGEAARAVAALAQEVRRIQADQREQLGRLALDVVRRVAGELGPQAVLEAVVERTVRELLSDQPLSVRVAPAAAPGVAERLAERRAEVEVLADPDVAEGECVVLTPQGSAHAGLELQLAALERAFADMAEGVA